MEQRVDCRRDCALSESSDDSPNMAAFMRDVPPSRSGWRGSAHLMMKTFVCISWRPVGHIVCGQRMYQNREILYVCFTQPTSPWRPTPTGFIASVCIQMGTCPGDWWSIQSDGISQSLLIIKKHSSARPQARLRHTAALPRSAPNGRPYGRPLAPDLSSTRARRGQHSGRWAPRRDGSRGSPAALATARFARTFPSCRCGIWVGGIVLHMK